MDIIRAIIGMYLYQSDNAPSAHKKKMKQRRALGRLQYAIRSIEVEEKPRTRIHAPTYICP